MKDYSIVIRTLGTGGKKYQNFLDSITKQTLQPKHIYVVLPNGYELPHECIGMEEFLYTQKGMWNQRIYGLNYAANKGDELLLVCDDDISFESTFAMEFINLFESNKTDILIPHIGPCFNQATPLKEKMLLRFLGQRRESSKSHFYVSIDCTAGHTLNKTIEENVFPTQSGQFACFMISPHCVQANHFEDERWLDMTYYALPDDQIFFYKAYLSGAKIMYAKTPHINHLDHGSSSMDRKKNIAYSSARNYLIFWHRFLWNPNNGIITVKFVLGILYRNLAYFLFYFFYSCYTKQNLIGRYLRGGWNGLKFINSTKYKKLPKIRK